MTITEHQGDARGKLYTKNKKMVVQFFFFSFKTFFSFSDAMDTIFYILTSKAEIYLVNFISVWMCNFHWFKASFHISVYIIKIIVSFC